MAAGHVPHPMSCFIVRTRQAWPNFDNDLFFKSYSPHSCLCHDMLLTTSPPRDLELATAHHAEQGGKLGRGSVRVFAAIVTRCRITGPRSLRHQWLRSCSAKASLCELSSRSLQDQVTSTLRLLPQYGPDNVLYEGSNVVSWGLKRLS